MVVIEDHRVVGEVRHGSAYIAAAMVYESTILSAGAPEALYVPDVGSATPRAGHRYFILYAAGKAE